MGPAFPVSMSTYKILKTPKMRQGERQTVSYKNFIQIYEMRSAYRVDESRMSHAIRSVILSAYEVAPAPEVV